MPDQNEPQVTPLTAEARHNLAIALNDAFDTSIRGYSFKGVVEAYEAALQAAEERARNENNWAESERFRANQLEAALNVVETVSDEFGHHCPWCGEGEEEYAKPVTHKADCPRQEALRK